MFKVCLLEAGGVPQFRYIVRIANTDIDGSMKLVYGLASIKGVGYSTGLALVRMLNLDPEMLVGYLTDEQVARIEEALLDLTKLGLPNWMYNRRRDYETGLDMHLTGSDLILYARRDIEREIKMGSWKGLRHKLGYKVRGQRTRTTGRLGMTMGVRKSREAKQQEKR
ncbi:MAG: 30S ribosomal protein S13 [Thermoprotei archaeon]|nr:30S ribosomal protein S13 [Thermoprotei archaeon]